MIVHGYFRLLLSTLLLSSASVRAQASAQCVQDVDVLDAAATSNGIEVVQPDFACAKTALPTCTFDYAPLNSNYVSACTNTLKGKVFYANMIMECVVPGSTTKRTFNYDNLPSCYPSSCNEKDVDYEVQTYLYPALEQALAAQGLTCDIYDKATSSAVHLIANFALSGAALLVIMIQFIF
jgi:hypothetical protein